MKPAAVNLDGDREIYQGDDYSLQLYFYQTDGITLQNLAGYTGLKAQVRVSANTNSSVAAEFTCTAANQSTNPGLVTISLSGTQTTQMVPSTTAVWDYEMIDPNSKKSTWFAGAVSIIAEVTHA